MWRSRYALGLELSDYAIKIAEVRIHSGSKPTVTRHATERLPANVIEEGRIHDKDLAIMALRNLVNRARPHTRKVHFVLPGALVMVRFLKLPDLPAKRLRKVIEFDLKHNVPLPFETPHYDFVKLGVPEHTNRRKKNRRPDRREGRESPGSGGETAENPLCDVMLAAVPLDTVREYTEVVTAAGLKVRSIEIRPLSLYRLIERTGQTEPDGTFLVADVGETVSDLSIFHNGELRITRSIPIVFSPRRGSGPDGEPPETHDPGGRSGPDPETVFQSACSDLAHELERLIIFFRYSLNYRDREIGRIILSGDAPRLDEIARILANRLTPEVRLIDGEAFRLRAFHGEKTFPSLAVPIGLALRGDRR